MANEIQALLSEVSNERLRARLASAVSELRKTKKFGLVFEEHLPELLPIHNAKIRAGVRVSTRNGELTDNLLVQRVANGIATVVSEGAKKLQKIPTSELVVVKRFGEAIFPILRHVESVLRGNEAPHHTVIEADNYHALQMLEWLYRGKVDCIYIDPPYNTGARDWKYNNDYVDSKDDWRHSKWLSFMTRRLRIAKRLLRPENSVLIITIDENELNHLGVVLEDLFRDSTIQMVTSVINPRGVYKDGNFSRCDEYVIFVMNGSARVAGDADVKFLEGAEVPWRTLRRSDLTSKRGTKKGGIRQFYPIYVNDASGAIQAIGEALAHGVPRGKAPKVKGCTAVFPIRPDGTEMNWGLTPDTLRELVAQGYVKVGARTPDDPQGYVISYLTKGRIADITSGKATVVGREPCGAVVATYISSKDRMPTTNWSRPSHNAEVFGSNLLRDILGDKRFPFPKSLYAVADCIRYFTKHNKDALVLDFFGGSGTTAQAVMGLNLEDNGNRRCMVVTNNEVSEAEATQLRSKNVQPGSDAWEAHGICRSVTLPRLKFAIKGVRDDGTRLPGAYLTGEAARSEQPRQVRSIDFVSLEALSKKSVRQSLAATIEFPRSKVTNEPFLLSEDERVAALFDPGALERFIEEGEEVAPSVEVVYLPFPPGKALNQAKQRLNEVWAPFTKRVEATRPMSDGYPANIDFFRLEFLDRGHAEAGGSLADLLPALWMMAGCRGRLPKFKQSAKMLFFPDCPFAVLIEETAVKPFLAELESRPEIDWVFIVSNDQDSFSQICEWLPERIPSRQRIHLWRSYVDNFLINADQAALRDTL